MPEWEIKNNATGETLTIESDSEPTQQDAAAIFFKQKKQPGIEEPIGASLRQIAAGPKQGAPLGLESQPKGNVFLETPLPETRLFPHPRTALEGGYNTLVKTLSGAGSPLAAVAAPVAGGALGPTIAAGARGLFAGLGAKNIGETLRAYKDTPDPTTGQKVETAGDVLANLLMVAAPFVGERTPAQTLREPVTDTGTAIPKPEIPITTKGVPDASEVRETGAVHENVRPQPGKGEWQVPVEGGGEGVQPRGETPVQAEVKEGSIKPTDLRAAINLPDKILVGKLGETHADILKRNGIDPDSIPHPDPKRGFVDLTKPDSFLNRSQAQKGSGIKGTADAGGLDSSDLPDFGKHKLLREIGEEPEPPSSAAIPSPEIPIVTPAAPKTPIETLSTEPFVKVKVPEGATALRGTDAKGRSSVQTLANVNKGENPFKDSGITKIEAGTIGKDKQFKPMEGEVFVGMGAATPSEFGPGATKYPAIQRLTDQLTAVPPTGTKETITARNKIADAWSEGKSAWEKTLGKMRSVGQSIQDTVRGVRDINDLDRKVGELDWALQQSSGLSAQAKRSIKKQIRNKTVRDAAAIWIDAGGDENLIRQYLPQLPKNTRPEIRRAMELAANLPAETKQFAEQLRQFFGIRKDEAVQAGVFDEGLQDYYTHIWSKEENMPDSLRAAINNGQVSSYFQFAQRRKIPTFLEGIIQGKTPKLDPAEVVPFYNFLLDRAIASRKFISEASKVTASDGRPALLPTGTAAPIGEGEGGALIIDPRGRQAEGADYRLVDHPALRKWKWAGVDENGNPVLYKSDLAVHPEFYERIARMMDRGRLTPTQWGKAALRASTEVKAFKLGLISAFHTVHVGSHALFHWTSPFKLEEIDWTSPKTQFAVEKGHLKIGPSPQEIQIASEGILGPGLVHKIPAIGPLSKAYSEWTFGSFIPKLKLKTFENAYDRAIWMRDKLGAYKGLTDEQIAARIGDSVNNAYGELNHLFLGKFGRDPRFSRILRGIFLAPDFGEARLRFVEKAATKFGHEERLALATMFATFYLTARVGNWLSHGDPEVDDVKNAFSVKVGKNWYSMRSVIGDVLHAWKDSGRFMYNRLNPIYSRTVMDWIYGKDVSGRKLTATEKAVTRPLEQLIPIQLGSLTRDDQKLWQSFITSMGLQARSDKPAADIRQIYKEWAKNNPDPKIKEKAERQEQEYFAPSAYNPLRNALRDGDLVKARQEYDKLTVTHKPADIVRTIRPFSVDPQTFVRKSSPVIHGLSAKENQQFLKSLTPEQRKLYDQAQQEREQEFMAFREMLKLK